MMVLLSIDNYIWPVATLGRQHCWQFLIRFSPNLITLTTASGSRR